MTLHYDLTILGSGTTAFAGALKAAELGARVLMVEQSQLGGTCVNWGCIPSKTLIHKAEAYFEARRGEPFGLNLRAGPLHCEQLMSAKRAAVDIVRHEHYQQKLDSVEQIEVFQGHGRFISPREMQVGAEILVSDRFLIACGGVPRTLRIPGLAEVGYLTSYSALHLTCFPRSLIMVGGGVIALEMGQMFLRFGTEVTVLERGDRVLKEFDPRLSSLFQDLFRAEGATMEFGVELRKAFRENGTCRLLTDIEGEERIFSADQIMLAIGTAPATGGIGLEEAGVKVNDGGFILVDEQQRTSTEGIWAAGDCTGPPLIAPAGALEAEAAVTNMFDPSAHRRIDHRHTPMAVFTDPEAASVGISPAEADARGEEVVETYLDLQHVAKSHVMGGRKGGILMWTERESGRILGVQMLTPRAADIIHEATLAVRHGLTVYDLASTVHVYPTLSEGLHLAARENIRRRQQD